NLEGRDLPSFLGLETLLVTSQLNTVVATQASQVSQLQSLPPQLNNTDLPTLANTIFPTAAFAAANTAVINSYTRSASLFGEIQGATGEANNLAGQAQFFALLCFAGDAFDVFVGLSAFTNIAKLQNQSNTNLSDAQNAVNTPIVTPSGLGFPAGVSAF